VRVDVSVLSVPAIPIQHGLTGSLEVSTDRVTPFTLLLRALGGRLSGAHASEPAA
jgi:hypothetical protein